MRKTIAVLMFFFPLLIALTLPFLRISLWLPWWEGGLLSMAIAGAFALSMLYGLRMWRAEKRDQTVQADERRAKA